MLNITETPIVKTEQQILDAYASGEITDIYVSENCFYIPLRITGLGITQRLDVEETMKSIRKALSNFKDIDLNKLPEDFEIYKQILKDKKLKIHNFLKFGKMDRTKEVFANPEVLPRYIGLPILLDHPEDDNGESALLTFKNFQYNTIVGSVINSYVKGDAVWGIGKIYDLNILDVLKEFKSTSPAIVSYGVGNADEIKIEQPVEFNHLALVRNGHWDQLGEHAMEASKIKVEQGDELMVEETENVDSITSQIATPEVKEIKADEDEVVDIDKKLANLDNDEEEIVDEDEEEIVDVDEMLENKDEDEVIDIDEQLAERADSVEGDVEKIKKVEGEEAKLFAQLAQDHKSLKSDEEENLEELKIDNDEIEEVTPVDEDDIVEVEEKADEDEEVEAIDEDEIEEVEAKADNEDPTNVNVKLQQLRLRLRMKSIAMLSALRMKSLQHWLIQ